MSFIQNVDGFKYAQIFIRDKKFLVSKIVYLNNGFLSHKVLIEDIFSSSGLNYKLGQFSSENDKKFKSRLDASVFTKTGKKYDGKLEMFSKQHLFLQTNQNYLSANSSSFSYKIPVWNVDSLMIPVKRNLGPYLLYGASGGFIIGFIAGYARFDDDWGTKKEFKWLAIGGIGAGIGLLFGWIIGETALQDILTINFSSQYDVVKLKEHSAYYFQQDKSVEEKYVEIK